MERSNDFSETERVGFETPWEEPYNWIHHLSLKFPKHVITVDWEEEQGYGEIYTITAGKKEIIEKWDIAEWGDEQEIDGFTVAQCTKSGGRNEFGDPKYGQYLLY